MNPPPHLHPSRPPARRPARALPRTLLRALPRTLLRAPSPARRLLPPAAAPLLIVPLLLLSAACGGDPGLETIRAPESSAAAVVDTASPFPEEWAWSWDAEPVEGRSGVVSTTDAYASEVGLDVLREGGNAVDAVVAVAFALAVVNPEAGNLGGGGFLVVRTRGGETAALDFRERAPLGATREMFLDDEGRATDRSLVGHLASGVPGTVMGLEEAHARYGSLSWERLLEPAIRLARGFEVGERHRGLLSQVQGRLRTYDVTREIFLPGGGVPEVGDTLRQDDLAATLERIRDEGADDFYRGRTAELLVAEMERGGGVITHEDLDAYTAVWRDPVRFRYRGRTVVSMPPPSSGGIVLGLISQMLERWDLGSLGWHAPRTLHLQTEVFRRAYADRNRLLADPDFVDVPRERLLSPDYARERAADIDLGRATPSADVGPGIVPGPEGENTTHVSVVDRQGMAVALTTTLNSWFGSRVTVEGAGFVLNNTMNDFAIRPGTPNQFGLIEGEQNALEPGKRPLSAMTPTIVLDGRGELLMVTGTPGGGTIITTVFQTLSNVVDHGMNAAQAVNAPRIHHQHLPDRIRYEPDGLEPEVVAALRRLGHQVVERTDFSGDAQVILRRAGGVLEGWSDPRRGGEARAY